MSRKPPSGHMVAKVWKHAGRDAVLVWIDDKGRFDRTIYDALRIGGGAREEAAAWPRAEMFPQEPHDRCYARLWDDAPKREAP